MHALTVSMCWSCDATGLVFKLAWSNLYPHLHIDLNRLPLSTLGVRHPFCVILARVDHRLGVFRLLLQGEGDPAHAHGPAPRWQQAVR